MTEKAPYGSWKSPISSDLIVLGAVGIGQIALDGDDVYWVEMRPSEGGRMVIVRSSPDGTVEDITAAPFSARTRVHEYGGGAFLVADGTVFFSNYSDQRLYRQDHGEAPRPITPESSRLRYADGEYDWERGRIICVREEHSRGDPLNTIVSVDADGEGPEQLLFDDSDFCSNPRLNPDGNLLAWLAWDHPNMPWDGTYLYVAEVFSDGYLGEPELVAGGDFESISQPEWSPEGVLHFVSDRTGWWNLYRWNERRDEIEALTEIEAEFARPQWVLGAATYGFVGNDSIVCSYVERGQWKIGLLDTVSLYLDQLVTTFTEMGRGDLKAADGRVVFTAGAPAEPMTLFFFDTETGRSEVLRRAHETQVDEGYLSLPEAVEFPTSGGNTAHAFYYPPKNKDFVAPLGEKPPLLVKSHGGPTGAASTALDLGIQYWTSRGIGVLDVNYGGSTGYGAEYRRRLAGAWGVVDVEDCSNAARYLVERGEVDGDRLAIDGGSAGGYTTLAALTFGNTFKAGASYYGVSDLEALAKDTHKFESRYLDGLVGPYPETEDLYRKRSPINHTDLLDCPLILFQGLDDKIVPPNQAQMMFEAVREKGLPTAYLPFEGEQHGFRRAENIIRALEAELYFYSVVFGFPLADEIEPVRIGNLAQPGAPAVPVELAAPGAPAAGGTGADAPNEPETADKVAGDGEPASVDATAAVASAPLEESGPPAATATGAADPEQGAGPFDVQSVIANANAVDIEDLAEQFSSIFVDAVARKAETGGTTPEPETGIPGVPREPPDMAALVSDGNSVDIEDLAEQLGSVFVDGMAELERAPADAGPAGTATDTGFAAPEGEETDLTEPASPQMGEAAPVAESGEAGEDDQQADDAGVSGEAVTPNQPEPDTEDDALAKASILDQIDSIDVDMRVYGQESVENAAAAALLEESAEASPAPAPEHAPGAAVTQSRIDSMPNGEATPEAAEAVAEPEIEMPESQPVDAGPGPTGSAMDQLNAAVPSSDAPPPAPKAGGPPNEMSQEEFDALIQRAADGDEDDHSCSGQ